MYKPKIIEKKPIEKSTLKPLNFSLKAKSAEKGSSTARSINSKGSSTFDNYWKKEDKTVKKPVMSTKKSPFLYGSRPSLQHSKSTN